MTTTTIKHLIISGGGPTIIQTLGSLHYLYENEFIKVDNIESIYATSAGAIIAVLLCLRFEWQTIFDYIIMRPWNEVFPINVSSIVDTYVNKGIFNITTFEKCMKPLFDAKDISCDITLLEFYEYSKVEIHFFTFEINVFELVDVSYKTHPNLSLLSALHMTCALPVIISPVCIDGKCFIDGGIMVNYPLNKCTHSEKDEILGFKNKYENYNETNIIESTSTLLDFILNFVFKLIYNLSSDDKQIPIKNEIVFDCKMMNITNLSEALHSIEHRKQLWEYGRETSKLFMERRDMMEADTHETDTHETEKL
jgi:predicted acylesterase/phospholipase RssA